MKVYLHVGLEGFTNSYIVANEEAKEALIIDPEKVTNKMISQIEEGGYTLSGVLITHNHKNHVKGLTTLRKIYDIKTYAAESEIEGEKAIILKGDGIIKIAGLDICYCSLPGHSSDSMIYKIGNMIFTGDVITAGIIGETNTLYARMLLMRNIREKITSQQDDVILMPGHGPPSTIGAEKKFNIDLNPKSQMINIRGTEKVN